MGWNRSTHFFALFVLLTWRLFVLGGDPKALIAIGSRLWWSLTAQKVSPLGLAAGGPAFGHFNQTSGHRPLLLMLTCPWTKQNSRWQDALHEKCSPSACPDHGDPETSASQFLGLSRWHLDAFRSHLPSWITIQTPWGRGKPASQFMQTPVSLGSFLAGTSWGCSGKHRSACIISRFLHSRELQVSRPVPRLCQDTRDKSLWEAITAQSLGEQQGYIWPNL